MDMTFPHPGTQEYRELEAKLRTEIKALRPDERYFAGRRFFEILLEEQGPMAVYAFLGRANEALQKAHGELEVADFSYDETLKDVFKRSCIKYLTRRAALGVIGEGIGGAALGAYGLAGVVDQVRGTPEYPQQKINPDSYEGKVAPFMPTAYVVIGAGMIYAAERHQEEYKLGDVANAVSRLIDRLPAEHVQSAKAQSNGKCAAR